MKVVSSRKQTCKSQIKVTFHFSQEQEEDFLESWRGVQVIFHFPAELELEKLKRNEEHTEIGFKGQGKGS